ncbi:MAG: TerC/Alx family metal homeostasis membrane protein [Elusimicrobiota bacterium]|jgi:tellurite resistance protein TerC|nr:TerC/Alx family metal homeostasis membrane protein [Elusimicrobiota bacterium]
MDIHQIMWLVFWIVIASAFFVDIFIMSRRKEAITLNKAAKMVCIWVSLALLFAGAVYFAFGKEKFFEFLTGYIVEYSLSIDNMFVFLMIFTYFAIPAQNQHKVLIFGIIGAIVLRFLFIFIGVELINNFTWMIYVFGAILIWTGIKMLKGGNEDKDPSKNIAFVILKKIFPFKDDHQTANFFIKENAVLFATPMLAAVFVIELSDVIFAVDSIPAVLSITRDAFIVYSSNIFAILGLRALYFMLAGLADKFRHLKIGVAVILFFVGVKMLISHYVHISSILSLLIILTIIIISIAASLAYNDKNKV